MIKTVDYTNLQGATATLALSPLTVITGENAAGKTRILNAIILATTGHLPSLGKTNAATWQLSSASPMKASVEFLNGAKAERTWTQRGKTVNCKTSGHNNVEEVNLLAAAEFISAKPADRLRMLADETADWSAVFTAVGPAFPPDKDDTVLEHAEKAVETLKERRTAASARFKQFQQTVAGLVELQATPPKRPVDLSAALEASRREIRTLREQVARLEEQEQQAQDSAEFIAENAEPEVRVNPSLTMAELQSRQRSIWSAQQALDRKESELHDLQFTAHNPVEFTPEQAARLAQLEEEKDLEEQVERLYEKRARTTAAQIAAQLHRNAMKEVFEKMQAAIVCPTCQASHAGWKDKATTLVTSNLEEALDALDRANIDLNAVIDTIEAKQADLKERCFLRPKKQAVERQAEALAALPAARQEIQTLKQSIDEAENTISGMDAALLEHQRYLRLRDEYQAHRDRANNQADLRQQLQSALEAQMQAEGELTKLEEQHAADEENRTEWENYRRREKDIQTAQTAMEEENETMNGLETHIDGINAAVEKTLRTLYEPILRIAKRMSEGLLPSPLDLHPTTAQIGYWCGDHFRPFPVLSGSEQLVAIAALQAARASRGSGIVLLDEVARMSHNTKLRLLGMLERELQEGTIQQAILIDHTIGEEYAAWQTIQV